jgi:PAS domain S-box-containing protein
MKSTIERVDTGELLKVLGDEAPVGICVVQDGRLRYFNSNFPVATGYRADELIGKDSLEIVAPEDREMVRESTRKMLKGELHSPYEFRVIRKDGGIVWIVGSVKSIRYHGRRAALGTYMEVTERKQAEERMRDREKHYRLLAENIADVIWTVDFTRPTRLTYISPSVTRLLGYRVDESMRKEMEEIFTPSSFVTAMKALAEEANREHRPYGDPHGSRRLELQLRHKSGRLVDVEASFSLIRGANGQEDEILAVARDITGRKQVENALNQSEERYRTILEEMGDGYFETDLTGNITFANDALCDLFGYSREDLVGMNYKALTPEEDVKRVFEAYNTVYKTGRPLRDFDRRIIRKDRTYAYAQSSVFPIRDDRGEIVGFRGVRHDVTERRQAEERLKESEGRYRLLFETSPDCITQLDREGRYLTANPATSESLGVKLEELIGKTVFEVMPREIAQHRFENIRTVLDEWRTQVFEDERGGRYFHHMVIPLKTSDQGEAVQVITRDITETKLAEEALRRSEQVLESVLESAPDGVYLSDPEGTLLYGNRKAEEITGYKREELVGKNFLNLGILPEQELEKAARLLEFSKAGKSTGPDELQLTRKDGSRVWTEINTTTIGRGEETVVIGFVRDVTERKQAAEALRRSEERYRTILEEMEDSYFEVDLGGHLTFVNNATCRALRYSKEELIGMSYKEFTDEEDVGSVFRSFNDVHRTGVPNKGFCWRIISKDGTRRFAEHSAFPLRNDNGEIIGFRGVGRDVTERREAEEKLRQSRENYRALFDSSVIGAVVMDAETMKVVMANQAAMKMFGFDSPEEGVDPLDFVPLEDRQKNLERIVREVFEADSRTSTDVPAIARDGRNLWLSVTGARIMHKGRLAALFSFVDITERKQAEERLRQSEENYRTLFDSSVVGMYVLDVDTFKVLMGNRAAAEMAGFSSTGEGIGINPLQFVVPEDREQLLEIAGKEFEQDLRRTHEVRVVGKDGQTGWITISSAKIVHEGQPAALVSITDITERKRMEEALRQSEGNYRALFDSSVIGTLVLDGQTMKVVMANEAAAKVFGFASIDEGIGLNPIDFVPPEDSERALEVVVKELFEQDLRQPREIPAVTKDGRRIWISATGARIMHQGKLAGLVSFAEITEQKRQRERLMMTDRLASLGELAAGTAHELNNPLTSIIGFSQLLMEKEVPDDIREDLKLVHSEAQRAATVTKNLLTFARKHAPVKQPNQINSIIEDVLKMRAHVQGSNRIEVEQHLATGLPELLVDYFQMQQVFLNIIINAEYFMTEAHKGGTLTVTTKRQNGMVVISIADDGPGIPPENVGRIFDPFFTTKEAGKGTGLGLSICHGIVTEHGGQIYVRSRLGKGTTVLVELPLREP